VVVRVLDVLADTCNIGQSIKLHRTLVDADLFHQSGNQTAPSPRSKTHFTFREQVLVPPSEFSVLR